MVNKSPEGPWEPSILGTIVLPANLEAEASLSLEPVSLRQTWKTVESHHNLNKRVALGLALITCSSQEPQ